MKQSKAEVILRDPGKYAHHDRIFLNNPVIMQGMGLAPVVVLATSGRNALMLAAAVALLLTPSRVLSYLLSKLVPLEEHASEEELRAKLLPRGLIYSGTAAVVYFLVYPLLRNLFGTELLTLGIYLPMLVLEPLIIYRYGRVQETLPKAVSKGLRVTVGYVVVLLVHRLWLCGDGQYRPVAPGFDAGGRVYPAGGGERRMACPGRLVQDIPGHGGPQSGHCQPSEGGEGQTVNTAIYTQAGSLSEALTIFFGYAVMAVLAQNAVFTRALGVSRLVQLVGDERTNSLLFGVLQCITQFLLAPVAWYVGGAAAALGLGARSRPLVYLACIAVVSVAEMAFLYFVKLPWQRQLLRILPLACLNTCVLGTLLLGRTQSFSLLQSMGFGLGSGVGYLLAVLLVTEAQNRLRSQSIPSAFRGMPITLIYIGVLALAIYGLTGHTVIL